MKTLLPLILLLTVRLFSADSLSLQQAVSMGLARNHNILMARNESQIAQNDKLLGIGAMLPAVKASGSVVQNRSDASVSTAGPAGQSTESVTQTYGVSATWTLFDGFQMFYAYSTLQEKAAHARYRSRDKIETTAAAIIRAYLNAVLQQSVTEIYKDQAALSLSRLERIRTKRELGGATEREWLNARVLLNADSSALLTQQLNRIQTRNTLNRLLDKTPNHSFVLDTSVVLPEITQPYTAYRDAAEKHNAGLHAIQHQVEIQRLSRKMAWSRLWPVVSVSGSASLAQTATRWDELDPKDLSGTSQIGVSAALNLFQGFKDYNTIRNEQRKIENAEYQRALTGLTLNALVYEQHQRVTNGYQKTNFDKKALELAERNFAVSEQGYRLGKLTGLEVRDAQLQLLRARIQLMQSRVRARIAVAELERLAGMLRIR